MRTIFECLSASLRTQHFQQSHLFSHTGHFFTNKSSSVFRFVIVSEARSEEESVQVQEVYVLYNRAKSCQWWRTDGDVVRHSKNSSRSKKHKCHWWVGLKWFMCAIFIFRRHKSWIRLLHRSKGQDNSSRLWSGRLINSMSEPILTVVSVRTKSQIMSIDRGLRYAKRIWRTC